MTQWTKSRSAREGKTPTRKSKSEAYISSNGCTPRNRHERKKAVRAGWMVGPVRQLSRKELADLEAEREAWDHYVPDYAWSRTC